jgi:hypothetical protein
MFCLRQDRGKGMMQQPQCENVQHEEMRIVIK